MSSVTKRLSWGLALSLALNLFLLGFGSARWLRHDAHGAEGRGPGHPHRELPRLLGPPTPELRAQHRTLHEARREVGEVLAREPYQRAELEAALLRLRQTTARSQELLHQHLIERASALSPEERRAFARKRFVRELGGEATEPPPHEPPSDD